MGRDRAKQAAYMREWVAKNRDKVRAAQRARRAVEDPEKRRAAQNAWYARNRTKLSEKARKRYREETGELIRARSREWVAKNPERKKATDKKYYRNKRLENILWLARRRAEKNGYPFSLTKEHIIVPALCPYLGVPFAEEGEYIPTLDRIKPELGYVPSNILVVTKRANRIKNNATWIELLKIGNALKQLGAD